MGTLPLNRGLSALVDDADLDRASKSRWFIKSRVNRLYVYRTSLGKQQSLSNFILGVNGIIDHKNGNVLDYTRDNLRPCTQRQNSYNTIVPDIPNKTSKFKGVFRSSKNSWRASICGEKIGAYHDELEAARAYDAAALKRFGEFAKTNEMMGLFEGKDPHAERRKQLIPQQSVPSKNLKHEPWNDKFSKSGKLIKAYRCPDGMLLRIEGFEPVDSSNEKISE